MEEQEARRLQAKLRDPMREEDFGYGEALQSAVDLKAVEYVHVILADTTQRLIPLLMAVIFGSQWKSLQLLLLGPTKCQFCGISRRPARRHWLSRLSGKILHGLL